METVGRYQIKELIGKGAMAQVYRAHDPGIDRTIAIKLLQHELIQNPEYRARFVREAKAAGVLSHPNIVTIFDVGEHEDRPYIAMELIDGATLSEVVKSGKKFQLPAVLAIGIQLARGLDYAHKKGVIHRDIKPGNIMLLKDATAIKIADFGICRIESGDATQSTHLGQVLGTPNYMSPEQVLGHVVDSRSDLFSVGVVLYQLLTGALPFEGETLATVAYKIVKEDPVPIDKLRPDLPLKLRRAIDRALKKQPERRYQSGEEFAQALQQVADEISQEADTPGKPRAFSLQWRWAASMAAIVAITMLIASAFIYHHLSLAITDQVMSYGGSLAKFMASQSALPLRIEDEHPRLQVFIEDTTSPQDFAYLVVLDAAGMIQGSNQISEIGQAYVPMRGTPLATKDPELKVQSSVLAGGRRVLDFSVPVLFLKDNQAIVGGHVHLGLFQEPLTRVANLSLVLMGVLLVVTSTAVALGGFVLAKRLLKPIRILANSLVELGKGHYDYRISETRQDEFGELFRAFDDAASKLQQRHDDASKKG